MNVLESYIVRQSVVVDHLAKAAELIPQDKLSWKPCEKAHTWLNLIDHTAICRRDIVLKYLLGEPLNFPGCFFDPANMSQTTQKAATAQRESWEALKGFLLSQPDEYGLQRIVPFWGGSAIQIKDFLWAIYDENVHHRGQAWIYARMNGVTPPSIWGTEC